MSIVVDLKMKQGVRLGLGLGLDDGCHCSSLESKSELLPTLFAFQMSFIMLHTIILSGKSRIATFKWTYMIFHTCVNSVMSCQMARCREPFIADLAYIFSIGGWRARGVIGVI